MNDDEVLALAAVAFPGDIDRAMKVMDRHLLAHFDASLVVLWRAAKTALAEEDRVAAQRAAFERQKEKVFPPGGYIGGGGS